MPRQAQLGLFKVSDNRASAFEPLPAILPGSNAPVVCEAGDGDREIALLSWGFVLLMKGAVPKRVTNFRDDKIKNPFWRRSVEQRRCLVPVTSFAEPKGKRPAIWHWFALNEEREAFAFAGIWRSYKGPLKKDGETVEIDTYAFMTTRPNELVASVHPTRMPVMLVGEAAQDQWISGSADEALELVRSYPADKMMVVQEGLDRKDLMVSSPANGARS